MKSYFFEKIKKESVYSGNLIHEYKDVILFFLPGD
jgi:hypothetical protein